MKSNLTFHGGAGSVTGVNILLDTGEERILLDCGLLQREKPETAVNGAPFAYDPASIHTLLVSHAHADHIGRIPKLVRDGFAGTIYSTDATKDLASIMFHDALRIMGDSGIYDAADVEHALSQWDVRPYHEPFAVGGVMCTFLDAGHILGSAMIQLTRAGRVFLYTGDLGNSPEPLLPDTESPEGTHILVMESVYGDRVHEGQDARRAHLRDVVETVRERKGTLLIPAFSIERTQILLHELNDLLEKKEIGHIDVYLDSPLAIQTTAIFRRHASLFNTEIQDHIEKKDDPFSFPHLHVTAHAEDSRELHEKPGPKIIIAGSGMSIGGRIRFHEKVLVPRHDTFVLFVGYQVPGSLGRQLLDGARSVEIDGEKVSVRAQIGSLSGYSGHKDRDALVAFVAAGTATLETVFVGLGEPKASSFLAQRLKDFLGVETLVPESNRAYEIEW